ncbi:hypothetical protein PG985_009466 [Apiospora marii]|uniref:uncharacterized protein n=1 Tax=Apiospora marii TaxID=335849 RepID=UPI003131889C
MLLTAAFLTSQVVDGPALAIGVRSGGLQAHVMPELITAVEFQGVMAAGRPDLIAAARSLCDSETSIGLIATAVGTLGGGVGSIVDAFKQSVVVTVTILHDVVDCTRSFGDLADVIATAVSTQQGGQQECHQRRGYSVSILRVGFVHQSSVLLDFMLFWDIFPSRVWVGWEAIVYVAPPVSHDVHQ